MRPSIEDPFTQLLEEFPLTTPCTSDTPVKHGVSHHITEGRPVFARPRRLSPEKLAAISSLTWESYDPPQAHGPLRSILCPRRMVNGVPVGTIGGSTISQPLVGIPFHTFRILHPAWLVQPFFPKLILSELTIRFPYIRATSLRLPSLPHLVFMNSATCLSAYETPLRPFNALSMMSAVV